MNRKLVIGAGVVVVALGAAAVLRGDGDAAAAGYRFVEVARGDVESTVSATGSLGAVSTVQVGTQVSGQVAEIRADFNDRVRKGQLIARIDPTLQEQAVREAEASLARTRAELSQRQFQYDQLVPLREQRVVTETDFRAAEYNLAVAKSSLVSAEASLERAQRNLGYTYIHAPIDGTVIERNVEIGQTVAASLSAPQLFLIAEDLSRMQILVSVDESDIGDIRDGQAARFTVQAYPARTFTGAVRQVRLQSKSQENVVNYTVVVQVANPDGLLLPGMTATVDFILAQAAGVLTVPNAALRFRATDAMQAAVSEPAQPSAAARGGAAAPDSVRTGGAARGARGGRSMAGAAGAGAAGGSASAASAGFAQLWYLDAAGALRVTRVRTGLTNGQVTEIDGPDVREGMQVIAAVTNGSATTSSSNSTTGANPFQSQQPQRGSGPPGPPPGGM